MSRPVVDVSHLPPVALDSRAMLWWGSILMVTIEATMFAMTIATYFYLRLALPAWPPPDARAPVGLPTIGLGVLVLSLLPMRWADQAAADGKRWRVLLWLAVGLAVGAAFLIIRVVEWRGLGYRWDSHAYGSIVWTILGLHTGHVVTALLETGVLGTLVLLGRFHDEQRLGLVTSGPYWDFVVLSWIPLYGVVYLAPHLMR